MSVLVKKGVPAIHGTVRVWRTGEGGSPENWRKHGDEWLRSDDFPQTPGGDISLEEAPDPVPHVPLHKPSFLKDPVPKMTRHRLLKILKDEQQKIFRRGREHSNLAQWIEETIIDVEHGANPQKEYDEFVAYLKSGSQKQVPGDDEREDRPENSIKKAQSSSRLLKGEHGHLAHRVVDTLGSVRGDDAVRTLEHHHKHRDSPVHESLEVIGSRRGDLEHQLHIREKEFDRAHRRIEPELHSFIGRDRAWLNDAFLEVHEEDYPKNAQEAYSFLMGPLGCDVLKKVVTFGGLFAAPRKVTTNVLSFSLHDESGAHRGSSLDIDVILKDVKRSVVGHLWETASSLGPKLLLLSQRHLGVDVAHRGATWGAQYYIRLEEFLVHLTYRFHDLERVNVVLAVESPGPPGSYFWMTQGYRYASRDVRMNHLSDLRSFLILGLPEDKRESEQLDRSSWVLHPADKNGKVFADLVEGGFSAKELLRLLAALDAEIQKSELEDGRTEEAVEPWELLDMFPFSPRVFVRNHQYKGESWEKPYIECSLLELLALNAEGWQGVKHVHACRIRDKEGVFFADGYRAMQAADAERRGFVWDWDMLDSSEEVRKSSLLSPDGESVSPKFRNEELVGNVAEQGMAFQDYLDTLSSVDDAVQDTAWLDFHRHKNQHSLLMERDDMKLSIRRARQSLLEKALEARRIFDKEEKNLGPAIEAYRNRSMSWVRNFIDAEGGLPVELKDLGLWLSSSKGARRFAQHVASFGGRNARVTDAELFSFKLKILNEDEFNIARSFRRDVLVVPTERFFPDGFPHRGMTDDVLSYGTFRKDSKTSLVFLNTSLDFNPLFREGRWSVQLYARQEDYLREVTTHLTDQGKQNVISEIYTSQGYGVYFWMTQGFRFKNNLERRRFLSGLIHVAEGAKKSTKNLEFSIFSDEYSGRGFFDVGVSRRQIEEVQHRLGYALMRAEKNILNDQKVEPWEILGFSSGEASLFSVQAPNGDHIRCDVMRFLALNASPWMGVKHAHALTRRDVEARDVGDQQRALLATEDAKRGSVYQWDWLGLTTNKKLKQSL